jgi:hypothetical protein
MSIRKPPTPLPNAFEELDRVQPPRRKKPEAQNAEFRQGPEAGDCAGTDNNGSGPDFRAGAQETNDSEKPYIWPDPQLLEDYLSPVLPMRPEMMSWRVDCGCRSSSEMSD